MQDTPQNEHPVRVIIESRFQRGSSISSSRGKHGRIDRNLFTIYAGFAFLQCRVERSLLEWGAACEARRRLSIVGRADNRALISAEGARAYCWCRRYRSQMKMRARRARAAGAL